MYEDLYVKNLQLKALQRQYMPSGLVNRLSPLGCWGCSTTAPLDLWAGSVSCCWYNKECGSAAMVGETVKTRQGVVHYRKYRIFSSIGHVIILSCALYFKFIFFFQDLMFWQDTSVAFTVVVSGLMDRRDLDSLVGLTSSQPGKTHAKRKDRHTGMVTTMELQLNCCWLV